MIDLLNFKHLPILFRFSQMPRMMLVEAGAKQTLHHGSRDASTRTLQSSRLINNKGLRFCELSSSSGDWATQLIIYRTINNSPMGQSTI